MNKKKNSFLKNRHLLIIMTFICIGAMLLTATKTVTIAPIRQAAATILVPFQTGLNQAGSWLSKKQSGFKQVEDLAAENEELKAQVEELREKNTLLSEDREEFERLQSLYDLDKSYAQFDKIGAQVISKDTTNWYSTFLINKGSDDGIAVDMNVISGGGLVGIVTEVGTNWAEVRSIIDDASNVSAMTLSTSDLCIVSGSLTLMDEGKLAFSQMNTENEIVSGEQIVTSSISDKYLKGILIGYIDEVMEDSNHLTKMGYLTPVVDFQHIEEVLVIKQLKETGGTE